jgi:hypothetical protein
MNKSIRLLGLLSIVMFFVLAYCSYASPTGYWHELSLGLSTTFLGLGLGVLAVNAYLASTDKRLFSEPLLKMILPNVQELHNDLFITHGRKTFGKDQFEHLIDIYSKHNGDPQAFSPEQRNSLYAAIESRKSDLLRCFDLLQEQLRELTLLLGWSFDSRVTAAALTARLNYSTFKALNWDGTDATKLTTIEAYFDAEAATSAVLKHLVAYLGLKDHEWQADHM